MKPYRGDLSTEVAGTEVSHTAPSLVDVLWNRRGLIAITVAICTVIAIVYLLIATPVYMATARLRLSQSPPRTFADNTAYVDRSETFMQTQADSIKSLPVIQRAVERLDVTSLKTFAEARGDTAEWFLRKVPIKVEQPRRSDILTVSVESRYREETAALTNAVVAAYIDEQSHYRHSVGQTMIGVLTAEREALQVRRRQLLTRMAGLKEQLGLLSLRQERGSTLSERTATLSAALTSAEMQAIELRAEHQALSDILNDPQRIADFVESRQAQGRDAGDSELAQLRQQHMEFTLTMASLRTTHGDNHPRTVAMRNMIDALAARIAQKELTLVKAHAAAIESRHQAATDTVRQLRAALDDQRGAAATISPELGEYLTLEAEVDRLNRQDELLGNRIAEVGVNSIDTGLLSIHVIEPAIIASSPVKPNKTLILVAAIMAGWVVGIGLALVREWQDTSLRTPEEIPVSLGATLLAMIPRVNSRLSAVARGQLVHLDSCSAAAEAYRGIRTSISLGEFREARTILVASPATGDGKSTTASNLAIAFAQAGERTLLIDCDLRNPVHHMIFESDASIGLTSVLAGEATVNQAIRPVAAPGLFLLPCGPIPTNPAELLLSDPFKRMMRKLVDSFDRIIIDSPPLMSVTDARILAADADATLLVLRMNKSMRELGVMALDGLLSVGARVAGAIANDVPASHAARYYGGPWPYGPRPGAFVATAVPRLEHKPHNGHESDDLEDEEQHLQPELAGATERGWSDKRV